MITRRSVSLAGGVGLLLTHPLSRGQARPRRVGVLGISSLAAGGHMIDALKLGMRDLGWQEGRDVEYRLVFAGGDVNRLDTLAADLIEQRVDVIIVGATQATRAAQRATKAIPIVMANGSDAVGSGFVASLARPGGNITGISAQNEEALSKLIEIVHEAIPGAKRIAILLNESNPAHAVSWDGAQSACAALNLVALRVVASASTQFGTAVEQIVGQRSQAVVVMADGVYFAEREKLQEVMQTTRLPVAYQQRDAVVVGGLLSYAADLAAGFRYTAKFVDKILKGTRPADLPVEQPIKFELVINLKTAKGLGITIPQSLLLRADEVIQ